MGVLLLCSCLTIEALPPSLLALMRRLYFPRCPVRAISLHTLPSTFLEYRGSTFLSSCQPYNHKSKDG